MIYSPGRYKDSPSRAPLLGVPSRGGPGGVPEGPRGAPPGGPGGPPGPRARKFPPPRGPPGGTPRGPPGRAVLGPFGGLLHRALDWIWGGIPGGVFVAQFVPKSGKKKFNLSRLGELLNTLRNVHPRPPGGAAGGAPGGPPGGTPWRGVPGVGQQGVQGPPDIDPPDIPPEDNPRI